jgi:hypothetical protein
MMFLPLLFTAYPFPKVRSAKKKEKKTGTTAEE